MKADIDRQWEVIGRNIKRHRLRQRLSLRDLGLLCGASASFLSQLERGVSGAHISTLMQIGASLHVSLSELTMEADNAEVHVVRALDRGAISSDEDHQKFLITRKSYGSFEVFIHRINPETANASEPYTHGNAQECIYILSGEVDVRVGAQTIGLRAGDAMEYRSSMPHLITNPGKKIAEVLFVVGPDEP